MYRKEDGFEGAKQLIKKAAEDTGMNVKKVECALKAGARSGKDVPKAVAAPFGGQEPAKHAGEVLIARFG